jgi:GNAT superfamily N-acetyltransferase
LDRNGPPSRDVEIRRLSGGALDAQIEALAGVLLDCVDGGASVGFMPPFTLADARAVFETAAADVDAGRRLLLGAFLAGELVGTVQVVVALPANQPHRGEITKLLTHRSARNLGIAQQLMERAEAEARSEGKTLLVLDTCAGSVAERLYLRLGWTRAGVIPEWALYPDGSICDTVFLWKKI